MASEIQVLILANLYDFSTDLVCEQLTSLNIPFLRINRETLAQSRVSLDPVGLNMEYEMEGRSWTVTRGLRSIWYRQPVFLRNTPGRALSIEEQLDRSQWAGFLRGLTVFEEARWVNHPAKTYLAESKPYQLRRASQLGFRVPETVITNDHFAVRDGRIGNPFILKSVDTVLLHDGDEEIFAYSSIVDAEECVSDEFCSVPSTCQRLISPKLDLRVTVIGDRAYSVAITRDGEQIEGDWRLTRREKLQYSDYELPSEVLRLCKELVHRLGLAYGAIDLVETSSGVSFIEVNPTGEWGWLDSSNRPIARDIAELLSEGPSSDGRSYAGS